MHYCECLNLFVGLQRVHQKKHFDQSKPHKCDLCSKSFPNPSLLRDHKLAHSNERNFHCDECGKSFKIKSQLRSHKEYHRAAESRPCQCPKCPKKYPTTNSLKYHLMSSAHKFSLEEAKAAAKIVPFSARAVELMTEENT